MITDNQAGLKRLDWIVSWDSVLIEGGDVQLDENGDPILVYAMEQAPALDSEGDPRLDDDGEPLMELQPVMDADGNPVAVRRIYSDHLFIHESSAYFD